MRSIKGSLVGLVLAGILALAPTAAFAHGGGGGGHGGGSGGGGHFGGGGGHFAGFRGQSFADHNFALDQGAHSARHEGNFRHEDHFRHERHFFIGDPYWYDYPYYGYDYPYYGNYDDNAGDYSDGQSSPAQVTPSQQTIIAVQKELTELGYYHGRVDGSISSETERAIRWFQSVDKIPISGRIDSATLRALQIS
jgi:Putative peptidoglycan binding domain